MSAIVEDDGRDGWEESVEDPSRNPRRMDESMIAYLTSLDKQLTSGQDVDEEARAVLVDNVLVEMKSCTASAACDRRVNVIVEKICYASSITNIIEILKRFSDYAVFLARNRHSSHIIQAIVARLCCLLKNNGVENSDQEKELIDATLGFARPVLAEVTWLAKELSASHVIRALICVLAGIPVVSARKGKQSKHQHSVDLCETLENLLEPKRFYVSVKSTFPVPTEFHEALGGSLALLASLPTAELQDLVADSSSSAVLGLALRVVSNPELIEGGPALGERLARQTLNWGDNDEGATLGAPIFYGMSADKAGSYFLEAAIECCALPLFIVICEHAVIGRASEYAQESTANFVLQSVMRRLAAEIRHSGEDGVAQEALLSAGKSLLKELLKEDVFSVLVSSKGGVALWMLELAIAMPKPGAGKTGAKKSDWADKVGRAILEVLNAATLALSSEEITSEGSADGEKKRTLLIKTLTRCLSPKEGSIEEAEIAAMAARNKAKNNKRKKSKFAETATPVDRNTVQLLHARLVGALLKATETDAFSRTVDALARLPPQLLIHLCSNGPLSRAVIDPFLDGAPSTVVNVFLDTVRENLVQLASHYLGQFIIRRSFERADPDGKFLIANALLQEKDTLKRTKEGRASVQACSVDVLSREPEEWYRMVKRQARGNQLLAELESFSSSSRDGISKVRDKSREGGASDKPSVSMPSRPAAQSRSQSDTRSSFKKDFQPSAKDESSSRKRKSEESDRHKHSGADFEKISKLRGSNLGLNLNAEVERMQRERAKR
jgi:hypothetical protein